MGTVLRPATASDAPDIVHVIRSSRLHFMPYAPPVHTEAEEVQWAQESLIPSGGVTLALISDEIVGVLAARSSSDAAWIDQLYVVPSRIGQGIGSALLSLALQTLPKPIRLYTFQQNTRGRSFYEARGFRPVAFGDGSQNEERCPDVMYELGETT